VNRIPRSLTWLSIGVVMQACRNESDSVRSMADAVARQSFPEFFQGTVDIFVQFDGGAVGSSTLLFDHPVRSCDEVDLKSIRSVLFEHGYVVQDANGRSVSMPESSDVLRIPDGTSPESILEYRLAVVHENGDSVEVDASCERLNRRTERRLRLARENGDWHVKEVLSTNDTYYACQ